MSSEDGLAMFATTPDALLEGVRLIGQGDASSVDPSVLAVLQEANVIRDAVLLESGLDLYQVAWVKRNRKEATRMLGVALRILLPVQVIEQELRGYGATPEEGVLDLLRLHRAVPPDLSLEAVRATFRWMNSCGVLVYSRKDKTVRALPADPDAVAAGEGGMAAMISPRTPFSNVARLRRVLRTLEGIVTWADPHFGTRALEELAFELDTNSVTKIRIISGNAQNVITQRSWKDFNRFREEMQAKGIAAEWRIDGQRDWHDRWLVSDVGSWNMPPVNSLFQNQYSEILPSWAEPPVEDWWLRSDVRTD